MREKTKRENGTYLVFYLPCLLSVFINYKKRLRLKNQIVSWSQFQFRTECWRMFVFATLFITFLKITWLVCAIKLYIIFFDIFISYALILVHKFFEFTMSEKNILVIGSGGREHALCWKLSQSLRVKRIYALPGSYGIGNINKVENLTGIHIRNVKEISRWCKDNNIDFVIVGPEDPLADGIGDELQTSGIRCFGPTKNGALIESDKNWAKNFMIKHNIPTASFKSFNNAESAKAYIKSTNNALVVKASGLAAGKGVVVSSDINEACLAVKEILEDRKFGSAGDVVVIEEKLKGIEISVLAFVDSQTVRVMLPAQDHKRLKNNDEGPNTGGMGAYCPCPLISKEETKYIESKVLQKAIDGLRLDGIMYCGVLYAGIMLTENGPRVLEFNCRFGDPETQVILPLLETDLYEIIDACCDNKLKDIDIKWKHDLKAVGVVMASAGYPETSTKGSVIEGIPEFTEAELVFHSAIARNNNGNLVTNGGRVLIAVALSNDLKWSAQQSTNMCKTIKFSGPGAQYRTDIAAKALKFLSQTLSYKNSGVDIDAGDDLVQRIKPLASGTIRPGVLGGIGGFGGLFSLKEMQYRTPVLCMVTKGIRSKLKMYLDCEMFDAIGHDLVAMCTNHLLESGAEPIAFLDYIACGKLQVSAATQMIKGISEGCREINCALLGGETAEMPSLYSPGKYDLAGYCVGVVESDNMLPKYDKYEEGDLIIGLPSSGLHCDQFDYVFEVVQTLGIDLKENWKFGDTNKSFSDELLTPSKIYCKQILPLILKGQVKAISHVVGGFKSSLQKIIPCNYQAQVFADRMQVPPIIGWLAMVGNLSNECIFENFNCGVGMVFIASKSDLNWRTIPEAVHIGDIVKRTCNNSIVIYNLESAFKNLCSSFKNLNSTEKHNDRKIQNLLRNDNDYSLLDEFKIKELGENKIIVTQSGKQVIQVPKTFSDPVLVIGTDGVGTKLKIAQQLQNNSTIGIDLVAMCVNDILCNGAQPFTFSNYLTGGIMSDHTIQETMYGIELGCNQASALLMGCEMDVLPLLYKRDVYDLAGFSLGITERMAILPKISEIHPGDIVFGLPSSGLHSNGYSLVHKIMEFTGIRLDEKTPFSNTTFGEELLTPTKIYVEAVLPLIQQGYIKAVAHITGGGLIENIPRVLTDRLGVVIDAKCFNIPPIFAWLAENGNVLNLEMQRTYNCGIGLVLIVEPKYQNIVHQNLHFQYKANKIGTVVRRQSINDLQVTIEHFDECMKIVKYSLKRPKKRVAVLISGSGTNFQALLDATKDSTMGMASEIVLVISNQPSAYGIHRAEAANVPCLVVSHINFQSRELFDNELTKHLEQYKIDIICLAGYMRILSESFVRRWKGRLINIHPSLLPKHPGLHVQRRAIDAGDLESGCTVHFVDEGVDTGAIIVQESVPILETDDIDALTNRIQIAEHYAYPVALRLLATEAITLGPSGKIVFRY